VEEGEQVTEYASLVLKVDSTSAPKANDDLRALQDQGAKTEQSMQALAAGARIAGAAIAAAAAAAVAMVAASAQAADAVGEAAAAAGTTAEEFSRLQYAMQFDGKPEALGDSMKFLNNAIVDSQNQTSKAAAAFAALGVNVRNQDGSLRGAHDVLLDVASGIASMDDGALKASLAVDLFSRSGDRMIPFLNNGAEGIRELEAEADRLGITISGSTAAAAGHLTDQFSRMQAAGAGMSNMVLASMLPGLTYLGDEMTAAAQNSGVMEGAAEALATVLKTVLTVAVDVGAAVQIIGTGIGALAAAAVEAGKGNLGYAAGILKTAYDDAEQITRSATARVDAIWAESATNVEAQEARKQAAIHGTAAAAVAAAPVAAASPGKNSATMDAGSGIVTEDFGAVLARQQAENEQRLIVEQSFLDLRAKMYAESDEGRRELRALQAADEAAADAARKASLQAEIDQRRKATDALGRILEQGSAKSRTIAKAAEAFNKVMALRQIAIDTPVAAMGAYRALAPIPFVGPALGVAAAAAVYAAGAGAAGAVLSGGGSAPVPTGGGGTSSLVPPTQVVNSSTPAASRTYSDITIIGKGMPSWDQVAELMEMVGERIADSGGRLGKVRIVTQ
jgi:hypothetical protein